MSVRCITKVLDDSSHAGTELLMLVVLADYSDDEGNSYPAVASLARKCRMSSRNANYILSALQASGELKVLKNEGPRGTNRYRILLHALGSVQPLKPTSPLKSASPLKPTSPTPEAGFPKPLKPTSDEPSLNRQEPSAQRRGSQTRVSTAGWFERFWSMYPKKKSKADAERAFSKLVRTEALLEQVLAAIAKQRQWDDWTKDNGQFIPYPATWLRDSGWLDEGNDRAGDDVFAGAR